MFDPPPSTTASSDEVEDKDVEIDGIGGNTDAVKTTYESVKVNMGLLLYKVRGKGAGEEVTATHSLFIYN